MPKRKLIAEYKIRVFSNAVEVIGPVNDFVFFRRAMNSAEKAVLKDIEKQESKKIHVIPKSKKIQVVPSGMI